MESTDVGDVGDVVTPPAEEAGVVTCPGWFADASGTPRWWDGRRWTERVAPDGVVC